MLRTAQLSDRHGPKTGGEEEETTTEEEAEAGGGGGGGATTTTPRTPLPPGMAAAEALGPSSSALPPPSSPPLPPSPPRLASEKTMTRDITIIRSGAVAARHLSMPNVVDDGAFHRRRPPIGRCLGAATAIANSSSISRDRQSTTSQNVILRVS
jgi:hypothetical protein